MSENRNTSLGHVASGDIVERIRSLRYVHVPVASQLMAEAAAEIERLRNGASAARETVCPHVRGAVTQYCSLNATLTDDERAAILTAADLLIGSKPGAKLRSLLARLAVK
jgi:hypothetical protein